MTDFVQILVDMRGGAVATDCSEKLTQVVQAVRATGKKGKLTLSISISPSKIALGEVQEVEVVHDCTMVEPRHDPGKTIFYPLPDGTLSRQDPKQLAMFETEKKG